jgi:hypothetical protein
MHDRPERRITPWEHEHLLEAVQRRLDADPHAMRRRRETVEHPFGTIKARMGATHFLTKTRMLEGNPELLDKIGHHLSAWPPRDVASGSIAGSLSYLPH